VRQGIVSSFAGALAEADRLRLRHQPGARAGLVALLALTAAGPLLGLLWAGIAPRLDVASSISGSENAFTVQADIDATFGFICLGAGLVAGVLARAKAADGGWPVPSGLALGGLAGSLLAGWVGHLVRSPGVLDQLPQNAGSYVVGLVDMRVRATGLYLVLPVTALLVLVLSLWLPAPWPRSAGRGGSTELVEEPGAPDDVFAAASAFQPPLLPFGHDDPPAATGPVPASAVPAAAGPTKPGGPPVADSAGGGSGGENGTGPNGPALNGSGAGRAGPAGAEPGGSVAGQSGGGPADAGEPDPDGGETSRLGGRRTDADGSS
jgi:hypothetical protein